MTEWGRATLPPTWLFGHHHPGVGVCLPALAHYAFGKEIKGSEMSKMLILVRENSLFACVPFTASSTEYPTKAAKSSAVMEVYACATRLYARCRVLSGDKTIYLVKNTDTNIGHAVLMSTCTTVR